MKVFTVFKIIAQVLGVFPFELKKTFHLSKLYLVVNVAVVFLLILSAGLIAKIIFEEAPVPEELTQVEWYPMHVTIGKFSRIIILGKVIASIAAVVTKVIWKKEHIKNLNEILEFSRKLGVNSVFNTRTISDYYFIAALCVLLVSEITSTTPAATTNNLSLTCFATVVRFQIIMDEIMFCVICSELTKYHHAITQMILSLSIDGGTAKIARDNANISEIVADDFLQSQLQQINVVERPMERSYGRSVSARARKLEALRKMNLKIFNIYSNYSALQQYQLFISTAVTTVGIINIFFLLFAGLTQDIQFDSINVTVLYISLLGNLVSYVVRMFIMCYYNDKAFNEGIATKYTVQEILRTSNDKDFRTISKIFIEQILATKQFEICGVFAFNMTLPMTFMRYALNYVIVLVQYQGFKL